MATDSGFSSLVTGFNNLDVLNVTSYAVTGLSPATTYYYRVRANNSAGTSENSQTQVALTASASAPGIAVSTNSLIGFTYNGNGPSSAQSISVTASNLTGAPGSLSVAGSANYEVSATSDSAGFGTSASINYTNATLDATNVWIRLKANLAAGNYNSESISISGGGAANPATVTASGTVTKPTINLTTTNLGSFTGTNGLGSAAKTNTITGTNLLGDITIVATNFFEVSGDAGTTYTTNLVLTPTAGVISNAVLFRIASNAPMGSLGTNLVTLSSLETTNRTVQVVGTVVNGGITLTANGSTNALSLFEGETAALGVTLSAPAPAGGVSVTVANPDTTELDFISPIVVEEGATTAEVTLTAVSDGVFDPNQTVNLQATATDWTSSANLSVTVQNNDPEPLSYVSIISTNTASYTQNFDGLGTNTVANAFSATAGTRSALGALVQSASLDGWYAGKRSGNGTSALSLVASIGDGNSGGIYNLGAAADSDRALGTLSSGSTVPAFGALIKNDSPSTLTGLKISLTAEFWRSSTSNTNVLTFAFGKVDGNTVTTDNFLVTTNANSSTNLNIIGPAPVASNGALNGNSASNQASLVDVFVPVNMAPGEVVFIRWQDTDETGLDAALAIDNFSITAEANPLLAPEFDVIAGIYLTDQTVKISNYGQYPAGAEVRYTVDGSTPTATSSLYNDASGVLIVQGNGPVTLKAMAIQPESSTSSAVASVTYSLPKNVTDVAALRASNADNTTVYRVTGEVTFTAGTSFRNTKFFQDNAAGIQIDDTAGTITTGYTAGDNVAGIIGRISLFNGQLQMVPLQDFGAAVSTGNAVTPLSRTLTSLADADQAMLVVIEGVEFETPEVVFGAGGTNLNIKDSSTGAAFSGKFRVVFGDSDISAATIPSGTGTVTGIVQKTSISSVLTLTVGARSLADLSFSGAPSDTTPPVITLTGSAMVTVAWGSSYSDAGATATDDVDSSVTVNSSGSVNTAVPGTYTITYTASDVAGNAATPVVRTVTVSAPSSTPGADGLSGLLRYAFGASGPNDTVTKPTTTVSGGNLVLTAIVRVDDPKLTVVGQAVTSLGDYTNAPSITTVTGSAAGVDQTGVPAGTQRQAFTVPQGSDTRKFLRLIATLAP